MSKPTFELIVRFQDDPPTGAWREYVVDVPRKLTAKQMIEYAADDLARDWAKSRGITNRESIAKQRDHLEARIEDSLRQRAQQRIAERQT